MMLLWSYLMIEMMIHISYIYFLEHVFEIECLCGTSHELFHDENDSLKKVQTEFRLRTNKLNNGCYACASMMRTESPFVLTGSFVWSSEYHVWYGQQKRPNRAKLMQQIREALKEHAQGTLSHPEPEKFWNKADFPSWITSHVIS